MLRCWTRGWTACRGYTRLDTRLSLPPFPPSLLDSQLSVPPSIPSLSLLDSRVDSAACSLCAATRRGTHGRAWHTRHEGAEARPLEIGGWFRHYGCVPRGARRAWRRGTRRGDRAQTCWRGGTGLARGQPAMLSAHAGSHAYAGSLLGRMHRAAELSASATPCSATLCAGRIGLSREAWAEPWGRGGVELRGGVCGRGRRASLEEPAEDGVAGPVRHDCRDLARRRGSGEA
jgi:hypothetical protein